MHECNETRCFGWQDNRRMQTCEKQEKCYAHRSQNTHTHTLNKSNQFYISKISQDNLVSIH